MFKGRFQLDNYRLKSLAIYINFFYFHKPENNIQNKYDSQIMVIQGIFQ